MTAVHSKAAAALLETAVAEGWSAGTLVAAAMQRLYCWHVDAGCFLCQLKPPAGLASHNSHGLSCVATASLCHVALWEVSIQCQRFYSERS
jgi:hypothetical protein